MKKLLLLTLILAVAATGALAKDKIEYTCSDLTILGSDLSDRVGGDTIGTAVVIGGLPFTDSGNTSAFVNDYDVACPYSGSTSPDVVYSFTPAGDVNVDLDLCASGYDTKLYILTSDGGGGYLVVDCNDDSCPGWMSELLGVPLTGGVEYFVVVDGYGGDSGDYVLSMDGVIVVPPPANDVCAGAINLDDFGVGGGFSLDLCDYLNDYSPGSGGCTGYSANGPDAVYYAVLPAGGELNVTMTGNSVDASLYLITDCGDPVGSCVIGSDDTWSAPNIEEFNFTGAAAGTYYLIVDAYSGCGVVDVTINGMVPTEENSISTIKSMY